MNKFLRNTIKGLGIFIGIIIILYVIGYIYVITHKKQIVDRVLSEIREKLHGDISLSGIDVAFFSTFPRASVVLENFSVKDSLYPQHKHVFFQASKLYAQFNLWKLATRQEPLTGIKVEDASMYMFTDTTGFTNHYLFTPRKKEKETKPSDKGANILRTIGIENFRFIMDNRLKEKKYDIDLAYANCDITTTDSTLLLNIDKKSMIHQLGFNLDKGSFATETSFEGEFDLVFDKNKQQLSFNEIEVELKGHPFVLTGRFKLDQKRDFQLKFDTKNIEYEFAKSLLTRKIQKALSIVKISKPVDVVAELTGTLSPGDPRVNVKWVTRNNDVQSPFANVTDATFSGGYTNELIGGMPRKDPNSRIYFNDLSANWEGLKVYSENAVIDDLEKPMLNCDVRSDFELTALNNLLESQTFKLQSGVGHLNITYSGPLQENSNANTLLDGTFTFDKSNVLYAPRNIVLSNCSGNLVFKKSDVFVNKLQANVQDNKLIMNGSAKQILTLIKTNPGKISIDWNVYSPSLNLASFTSLLKKRNRVVTTVASGGKLRKVASQIDDMLNQANIQLQVQADQLKFKKFAATNVHAAVDMVENDWDLKDVSFNHANGSIKLTGQLKEKSATVYGAAVNVNMQQVDIHKVLYAFDNFSQDALMSENINGKLTTKVDVQMDLDRELSSTPSNLSGFIDFSLKDGALINFEPIKKLQTFLFKNRNFEDIRFAELKNRFILKDKDIIINRMEIQSTALTLFVEGVYSLKGNTDISIQIPLSNLKKRGEDYVPKNIGANAKAGMSVFVRGTPGEDGNIKFKLDVFNKIRKRLKSDDKPEKLEKTD